MNELKKKIILLLISILSLFSISIIFTYNISIYNKELNDLKDKFLIISSTHEKFKEAGFNPIFIENEVYEVVFDRYRNIDKIFSYSSDGLNEDELIELINKNIDKINSNKMNSLYTSNYIFMMNRNGNLLIINNENTKEYLLDELEKSIAIFIVLELVIILASLKITKWIVKPVLDSFNKQKQFIYDASHELKTPIAIIGASAETLENNPKEKKWLENIKTENERMNKLVINLLNLSKSEDIKENEIYSEINLSKLVELKTLSFESLIFDNNLKLETNIENNVSFKCNEDRIKELLSILIDNAIQHGLEKSKITVSLVKEKNNIILAVKNRGDEIPLSEREKIFERFYRIDKSRNRNENRYGLGLSIAKNIVDNHNGNIKVECEDGYTTFIVKFKQN